MDHLEYHKINILGCFPLFKKTNDNPNPPRPTDDSESTSFKIIIDSTDEAKFFNPDIWPEETIFTSWIFTERPPRHRNDPPSTNCNT